MGNLSAMAAFGIWPSLPIVGGWLLSRLLRQSPERLADAGLKLAAGIAAWSLPILLLAEFGLYDAALFGLFGWGFCLWALSRYLRDRHRRQAPLSWQRAEVVLALGLLLAAGLYFGFATESILGGSDQGVYANVGVFLAENGHLEVPYPWRIPSERPPGPLQYPGFYTTKPALTPQFSHLLPAWLAQAWASLGSFGLFRLNGVFALVALLCFYGVARTLLASPWAVAATLFLAFNPSQVWIARISLSEVLAQLFIWAGLLTLCRGVEEQLAGWMMWSGFFTGLAAAVRIDGFLLMPLLLVTHLFSRGFMPERRGVLRGTLQWSAFYATAVPMFLVAFLIYQRFSSPYFAAFANQFREIEEVSLALGLLLLVMWCTGFGALRWLVQRRWVYYIALGTVIAGAVYGYWMRPWVRESLRQEPGGPVHGFHHYLVLPNLMHYLSPLVLWLAIVGFGWVLWRLLHGNKRLAAAPLVVWLGFSVFYLYDPIIYPLHYWAIRRFIPVVIPGFILFAACGLVRLLHSMPRLAAQFTAVAAGIGFTIFTVLTGWPLFFFVESRGVVAQLEQVASELPEDKVILTAVVRGNWARWATPLFVSFDRRLAPIDVRGPRGRQGADRWIRRRLGEGEDVLVLYDGKILPKDWPPMEKVSQHVVRTEILRPTVEPLPRDIVGRVWRFDLYLVRSTSPPEVVGDTGRRPDPFDSPAERLLPGES